MRKVELIQSKLINITIPDKPSHFAPSSHVNPNKAGKPPPSACPHGIPTYSSGSRFMQ